MKSYVVNHGRARILVQMLVTLCELGKFHDDDGAQHAESAAATDNCWSIFRIRIFVGDLQMIENTSERKNWFL